VWEQPDKSWQINADDMSNAIDRVSRCPLNKEQDRARVRSQSDCAPPKERLHDA
jgi:hypothetical protein